MLRGLPPDARRQALAAYRLFREDPFHKGLQFKRIGQRRNIWSVRVGLHYRAVGERNDDRSSGTGSAPTPSTTGCSAGTE